VGGPIPHLARKKFLDINQTYIPTAVYIGVVTDGVILLKAFCGLYKCLIQTQKVCRLQICKVQNKKEIGDLVQG
jgi:hypothetical protein